MFTNILSHEEVTKIKVVDSELGFLFQSRQWEPPSALVSVEAYVYLQSTKRIVGNIGTYESAVLGVANTSQLQALHRSRPRRPRPNVSSYPLFPASQLISSACSILGILGINLFGDRGRE